MKTKTHFFSLFLGLLLIEPLRSQVPVEPKKNVFAGDDWKLPTAQPALKAAPGAEQINANCVLCHSLDYVSTQPLLTRAQWTAGVEKMKTRFGAPLTTNQIPALVEYLTLNYGKP